MNVQSVGTILLRNRHVVNSQTSMLDILFFTLIQDCNTFL